MGEKRAAVDVTKVAARAQAATEGPWPIEREELSDDFSDEEQATAFPMTIGPIQSWEHALSNITDEEVAQVEADAAFISASRTDVPALCDALQEQDEELATVIAEREEARALARRLVATERVLTCVYCGEAYPPGSPTHGADVLTAHVKACSKHPLREAEAAIAAKDIELQGMRETLQNITDTRATCDGYEPADAEQAGALLALFRLTGVDAGMIAIGLRAARIKERIAAETPKVEPRYLTSTYLDGGRRKIVDHLVDGAIRSGATDVVKIYRLIAQGLGSIEQEEIVAAAVRLGARLREGQWGYPIKG